MRPPGASMTLDVYSGLFADDLDPVAEPLHEAAAQAAAIGATAPMVELRR